MVMRNKKMIGIYLSQKNYDAFMKIVERESFNSITHLAEYIIEKYIQDAYFPDPMLSSKKLDLELLKKSGK